MGTDAKLNKNNMKNQKTEQSFKSVAENDADLAHTLYDHYCQAVGGKAFNGDPLPKAAEFFADESKEKQANAWRETAKKAFDEINKVKPATAPEPVKEETFLDRLIQERDELREKYTRLHSFLLDKQKAIDIVGKEQHTLLVQQLHHMDAYASILDRRIALL